MNRKYEERFATNRRFWAWCGRRIVIMRKQRFASDDFLAHLQAAGASYFFCGRTEVNLSIALDKLRRTLGIKKLMLEGGGKFNGSMLHAGELLKA